MNQPKPLTEESVREILEAAGARVMSRGGRTENYGAPREFSFEVKGVFANGLLLHVVARQYDYRDPWEATGRINEVVDVALLATASTRRCRRGIRSSRGATRRPG